MNTEPRKRFTHLLGAVVAAAVLPLTLPAQEQNQGAAATTTPSAGAESELAQIQQQFIEVKTELESAQQKALEKESVQKAVEDAEEALKSAMLEEAPQQREPIEEFFEVRSQIATLDEEEVQNGAQDLVQEFTQLSQELNPVMEKAAQTEKVQSARSESRDAILAAMEEINPNTPQLIEKQRQLMIRYQQLRQQNQMPGQTQGG